MHTFCHGSLLLDGARRLVTMHLCWEYLMTSILAVVSVVLSIGSSE